MEARPRVLVAVTYGFSVRYLLSTGLLERLAEDLHPVVALGWHDPDLEALFAAKGLETALLPDARLDHDFRMYRRRLDLIHQRRLASVSTELERRQRRALTTDRRQRAISDIRRATDSVRVGVPVLRERTERDERPQALRGTNLTEFESLVESTGAEGVLSVTPYHEQDTLLLMAAEAAGLRSVISVISFDNPTTRRRFPVGADRVLVWNRLNRDELVRSYPGLDPERVGIVGAPQFDLHRRAELVMDEAKWRAALGLGSERPVILYGGGPAYLVPGETALVELLDDAISSGEIRGEPVLLARRHPADDPGPWAELSQQLRNGVVAAPWAPGSTPDRGWPDDDDLTMLMSSLAHSAVHVNVCSSMTLDGAVFDRPQIGPRFVPGADALVARRVRDLYEREHWWPITRSGGLVTADDREGLILAVNDSLATPAARAEGRRRMVGELLSFDDGLSTERVAVEVATVFSRGVDR